MRRAFKPVAWLLVVGIVLVVPLSLGCAPASVTADPTPLGVEDDEDEAEERGR